MISIKNFYIARRFFFFTQFPIHTQLQEIIFFLLLFLLDFTFFTAIFNKNRISTNHFTYEFERERDLSDPHSNFTHINFLLHGLFFFFLFSFSHDESKKSPNYLDVSKSSHNLSSLLSCLRSALRRWLCYRTLELYECCYLKITPIAHTLHISTCPQLL